MNRLSFYSRRSHRSALVFPLFFQKKLFSLNSLKMAVRTLTAALLLALVASASAVFDWAEMSNMNSKQTGDATFYGQDPDQVRIFFR